MMGLHGDHRKREGIGFAATVKMCSIPHGVQQKCQPRMQDEEVFQIMGHIVIEVRISATAVTSLYQKVHINDMYS